MWFLLVPAIGIPLGLYIDTLPDEEEKNTAEQALMQSKQTIGVALQHLSERAAILNHTAQQSEQFQTAVNQTQQSQQQLNTITSALQKTVQQLETDLAHSNADKLRLKKELLTLLCKTRQIIHDLDAEKNKLQQNNTQLAQQQQTFESHIQTYLQKIASLTAQLEQNASQQSPAPTTAEAQIERLNRQLADVTLKLDESNQLAQKLMSKNTHLRENNQQLVKEINKLLPLEETSGRTMQFFRT